MEERPLSARGLGNSQWENSKRYLGWDLKRPVCNQVKLEWREAVCRMSGEGVRRGRHKQEAAENNKEGEEVSCCRNSLGRLESLKVEPVRPAGQRGRAKHTWAVLWTASVQWKRGVRAPTQKSTKTGLRRSSSLLRLILH
jgi:hypothetical protein